MATEIERKFMIGEVPTHLTPSHTFEIAQTYLALAKGEEVRTRSIKDHRGTFSYTMCLKFSEGMVRNEHEFEISESLYKQLTGTNLVPLLKTRKVYQEDGFTYELDFYDKQVCDALNLDRLVVAEVEFPSLEDAISFTAPSWFGEERTGTKTYSNKSLFLMLQKLHQA